MLIEKEIKDGLTIPQNDSFNISSRMTNALNIPVHYHGEVELALVLYGSGAKRYIGNHIKTISEFDLALVGPNVMHGWRSNSDTAENIIVVTVHWHRDLFGEKLLGRSEWKSIQSMFDKSDKGVSFGTETVKAIYPKILSLSKKNGFYSVTDLLNILHELSTSTTMHTLNAEPGRKLSYTCRRINNVLEFINTNFEKQIGLADAARVANMSEAGFSRYIKQQTGYTYIDILQSIRINHAADLLISTSKPVAEIACLCGFHNLSNFIRTFKKRKDRTPGEFRDKLKNPKNEEELSSLV